MQKDFAGFRVIGEQQNKTSKGAKIFCRVPACRVSVNAPQDRIVCEEGTSSYGKIISS